MVSFHNWIHFILFYFLWLLLWRNNGYVRSLDGNVLSIIGTLVPSVWLLGAYLRSKLTINKVYWILLFLSTFSYLLGELCSFYVESILLIESPSLNLYETFYMLSVFLLICIYFHHMEACENSSIH